MSGSQEPVPLFTLGVFLGGDDERQDTGKTRLLTRKPPRRRTTSFLR